MSTADLSPSGGFSFEVKWIDPRGSPRSAKAIGFDSPVKARVMAKALASEMGWKGPNE